VRSLKWLVVAFVCAVLAPPWLTYAQWVRGTVNGVETCVDVAAGVSIPAVYPRSKPDTTKACKGASALLAWLKSANGAAYAAGLSAVFPGALPDDIPNTAPPASGPSLHAPWSQSDIGSPSIAGDASDTANVLTTSGQGNFASTTVQGHSVHQELTGDYEAIWCPDSITSDLVWARTLIRIADSLDANSAFISASLDNNPSATDGAQMDARLTTGAASIYATNASNQNPGDTCLKVSRLGTAVAVYSSPVAQPYVWTLINNGSQTITFTGSIWIDVLTHSGAAGTLAIAIGTLPTVSAIAGAAGTVEFTAPTISQAENVTPLVISVSRSGGCSGAASVAVSKSGGTAAAGTDYTDPPFPVMLNWSDGSCTTQTQNVTLIDRSGVQASRTLNLALGSYSTVAAGSQVTQAVTITDNDGVDRDLHFGHGVAVRGLSYSVCTGNECNSAPTLQTITDAQNRRFAVYDTSAIANNANIKTILIQIPWSVFEYGGQGVYTPAFDMLQAEVTKLQSLAQPKSLILSIIEVRYNDPINAIFPPYIKQMGVAWTSGSVPPSGSTCMYGPTEAPWLVEVKWWNTACMNPYTALVEALGAEFDDVVGFEGLSFMNETAYTYGSNAATEGFSAANFNTNLRAMVTAGAAAWPHSLAIIPVTYTFNGSQSNLISLVSLAASLGVGIGAGDTCLPWRPSDGVTSGECNWDGVRIWRGDIGGHDYRGTGSAANEIIYMSRIEASELGLNSVGASGGYTPTQLMDFAAGVLTTGGNFNLRANYMIWDYQNYASDGAPCSGTVCQFNTATTGENAIINTRTFPAGNLACPTNLSETC